MTARTPTALKAFFVTGARPSQSNFGDLLDSYVNIVQASAQTITSDVSALGKLDVKGNLTVGGNFAVSGTTSLAGGSLSLTSLTVSGIVSAGSVNTTGDIKCNQLTASALNVTSTFTIANLSVTSTVSAATFFPTSTSGIIGTKTNNNAAAGSVGEYIESVVTLGSPVSLSTGATSNITFIPLTAGDWDVEGLAGFAAGGTPTSLSAAISTTSSAFPADNLGPTLNAGFSASSLNAVAIQARRISIATSTNAFLVANATFSSTMSSYGLVRARRTR